MRVVVDPNVVVSAAISTVGPPRRILAAWTEQRFELVASATLLADANRVLGRAKFRRWISTAVARELLDGLADGALIIEDPPLRPAISRDPNDDYLIALARAARADYLISGDPDLLELPDPQPPILSPRQFVDLLDA